LDVPGALELSYLCFSSGGVAVHVKPVNIDAFYTWGHDGDSTFTNWLNPNTTEVFAASSVLVIHLMGSRPFNRMTFEPAVLVDAQIGAHYSSSTGKCSFQAVAEVFG
jgi:hypothetical protein